MKTFTIEDIRSWRPCYDPTKYLPEDWQGTAIDILKMDNVPIEDRFWCVLRIELVSEKLMRLFAVWSARQVQHLMRDQRSINALNVAERFANGGATQSELAAARVAASDAAMVAASDAAMAAAWAAARDAAMAAAWAADMVAAWDAQRDKLIEMVEAENRTAQEALGGEK